MNLSHSTTHAQLIVETFTYDTEELIYLPLFMALFGRKRVIHVARRYERVTIGKHCLRPATLQYFWFHPSDCGCINRRISVLLSSLQLIVGKGWPLK